MRLYLLGCGTPTSEAERFGSSYVVRIGEEHLMFDCGPATTAKLVKAGLRPTWIDFLFFTHHHFDHDVDYPCFLLSRWNESIGTEQELRVFGPALTEQLTHRLMDTREGAFAHDWIARINHPLSLNAHVLRGGTLPRRPPVVHARDVGPGHVVSGSGWAVTAAPAEHVQPWLDSLAYRLDTDEGSVVFTGDTRPCDSVVNLARDVDTMVSLCAYVQEDIDDTPEAQYMCGSRAVAEMAQAAGARRLVLVHQAHDLDRPGQAERALRDITRIYDGGVVWGQELMSLDL